MTLGDLEERIQGVTEVFTFALLSQGMSYGLLLWPVHSHSTSQEKAVKNFPKKEARAYPGAAQSFHVPHIISVTV